MAVANVGVWYYNKTKSIPYTTGRSMAAFMGASFFGWFMGKLSYRKVCENKIMDSDLNTAFANRIRVRNGRTPREVDDLGFVPDSYAPPSTTGDFKNSNDSFDRLSGRRTRDTTKPEHERQYDRQDTYRDRHEQLEQGVQRGQGMNPFENDRLEDDAAYQPQNPAVTYDSLREQNRRDAYNKQQAQNITAREQRQQPPRAGSF